MPRFIENLAATPYEEDCAQVGSKTYDYTSMAQLECKAFIKQIARSIPEAEQFLRINRNPHDFGTYLDVVFICNEDDDDAMSIFWKVEELNFSTWDNEAKAFLASHNYNIK